MRSSAVAASGRCARMAATESPYLRLSLTMVSSRASICSSRSGSKTARSRRARARHHVLEIGLRALDGLDGGGRVRLVAREVAQQRGRAAEPRGGGLGLLGERADRLLQPGHDPLRVLQARALGPQLFLLAVLQPDVVDLGELESVEILLPGP